MYQIIVATDCSDGISKNNKIPWTLKKDMSFFKEITTQAPSNKINVVIMGRKTYESMNKRVLPKRINIILTTQQDYTVQEGSFVCHTLIDSVALIASWKNINNVFIIGGEDIYKLALEQLPITYVYKTVIYKDFECDRFFPSIKDKFEQTASTVSEFENDLSFHIEIWKNKSV
jgi:dihydrofolate reductase